MKEYYPVPSREDAARASVLLSICEEQGTSLKEFVRSNFIKQQVDVNSKYGKTLCNFMEGKLEHDSAFFRHYKGDEYGNRGAKKRKP